MLLKLKLTYFAFLFAENQWDKKSSWLKSDRIKYQTLCSKYEERKKQTEKKLSMIEDTKYTKQME